VTFQVSGRRFPVIIPPTYDYGTDHKARRIASSGLHERGYRVEDIVLPAKSLAVHAGLATYGRNNITCMEGWGSFFRLKAFCTDLPCGADSWQEPKMMDQCQECVACVKACPSGAIDRERFVIHAERCVTFLNEKTADFPGWVDPGWHSCLIGCMRCQDVCPLNRDNVDGVIDGPEFSEEETSLILGVSPPASLPARTAQKLKKVYMLDEYEVLPRNLKVLIERGR
jgi:epoxyqueuosine reductase